MCWREQARSPRSLVLSLSETSDRLHAPPRKTTVPNIGYQAGVGTFQKLATKQNKTQKQIGSNKNGLSQIAGAPA